MIKHFEMNTKGKDFVCGDCHGMFRLLEKKLEEIQFDENVDRLFCTGDLVDRHEDSWEFYKWLDKPWFHSVQGNHEDMTIAAFEDGPMSQASSVHLMNGGGWFHGIPTVEQQCYVEVMKEMPLGIEIETQHGLIGVVHAQVPFNNWDKFKNYNQADGYDGMKSVALWRRTIIDRQMETWVEGVDKVFVGHSYTKKPLVLGNYHFIDTGAVFGGDLTLIQINYELMQ